MAIWQRSEMPCVDLNSLNQILYFNYTIRSSLIEGIWFVQFCDISCSMSYEHYFQFFLFYFFFVHLRNVYLIYLPDHLAVRHLQDLIYRYCQICHTILTEKHHIDHCPPCVVWWDIPWVNNLFFNEITELTDKYHHPVFQKQKNGWWRKVLYDGPYPSCNRHGVALCRSMIELA